MVKCECKQEFKNSRALWAHKKFHCKSKLPCDCSDGGEWELIGKHIDGVEEYLGKINPDTGKLYKKWCTVCREVV